MKRKYLAASDPPDGWCAVLRDRTYVQKILLYFYISILMAALVSRLIYITAVPVDRLVCSGVGAAENLRLAVI